MSKNDRATVRVENLAYSNIYSNMLTLNALVELLDERGILTKQEVLERIKKLGEEARKVRGLVMIIKQIISLDLHQSGAQYHLALALKADTRWFLAPQVLGDFVAPSRS